MRTLCIAGVTMLGLIVYCFVSLFGTARLLSIADITRASGTPPSLLLLPKRRKQRRRKRTKGGALEWRQSTQPHESISLPQRKGRNASSCDCATPCRWRNTGAESPLDPLKFCYVFSSDCLFSTNGAHIVPGESAMSASSAAASIAWIHCDEHTHFDWFGTAEETTREWARQMKWRKRREGGAQGAPSRVPRSIRTSAGTLANRDVESAAAVSGARAILVNRKVWGVAAVARLSPESVRNALLDYLSRTQRITWSALERRSTAELVAWVASWDVEEGGRRRHDTTRRIGIDPSHPNMKGNKVEAGALAAAREEIFNRKLGGLHSGATLSPTAVRKVLITWLHSEALGYPLAELDRRSTAQLISWIQSWHHHDPHTLFHRRPLRGSVSPIDGSSLNHNANSLFATNHHHQPQSNHHHDYIYHVDCPGGAMGVNAGLWWWLIALAHRTNLRLVWNPSLFVSPNHPQYKSNPLFECHDDAKVIGGGRGCASPSDLWTGMGLWRAGSPVANGMTSRRLFQLIESGDMEAVLIDRREVYIDEKKYFDGFVQTIEMRKANWDQKKKAKPKVVIIKRCGWTHTREAINFVPGLQIWAHRAYQSARLALRSSLPEPLYSLKPLTFAIVVALRRGAGAIGIDRVEYISRVILAMFDSGVGLSCETAHTIVVSQPHETHLKELAHFDDALGKDCWTLHSSSYLDTSAAQSARDVFKDMDVLSNADVFIPSLMSKFSQLAGGTLAHPRSVKMVATGPGDCLRYFDAKSDLTWGYVRRRLQFCTAPIPSSHSLSLSLSLSFSLSLRQPKRRASGREQRLL